MTTAIVTEFQSYMSFEFKSPTELPDFLPYTNLNNQQMAPLENTIQPSPKEVNLSMPEEPQPGQETVTGSSVPDTDPINNDESDLKTESSYLSDSCSMESKSPIPGEDPNNMQLLHNSSFEKEKSPEKIPNINSSDVSEPGKEKIEFDGIYRCHKCSYMGQSDDDLHQHLLIHFPYECLICGYLTDIEARRDQHMKNYHPGISVAGQEGNFIFQGTDNKTTKKNVNKKMNEKSMEEKARKPKKTKCKLCDQVLNCKNDYYNHLKAVHANSGRLLLCNEGRCNFVALYKHHLEYHLRIHYGSKPYKCEKCPYLCINRSMLNSHYKSHSNVYQYSCQDCTYATKYLHSLKLHLRKYRHNAAAALNPDGSINKNFIIDINGRRRGPKNKKQKAESKSNQNRGEVSFSKKAPSPPRSNYPSLPTTNPFLYRPRIFNNYSGLMYVKSPSLENSNNQMYRQPTMRRENYACYMCEFTTESSEMLQRHLQVHFARMDAEMMKFYAFTGEYSNPYQAAWWQLQNFASGFTPEPHVKNSPNSNVESKTGCQSAAGSDGPFFPGPLNDTSRNEKNIENPTSSPYNCQILPTNKSGYSRRILNFMEQQYIAQMYEKFKKTDANENHSNSSSPEIIDDLTVSSLEASHQALSKSNGGFENPVPLDLSRKSPTQEQAKPNKNVESTDDYEAVFNYLQRKSNPQESSPPSQQTIKNRRKGKAFKYIPFEDQAGGSDAGGSQMEQLEVFKYPPVSSQETKTSCNSASFRPVVRNSVPLNFKSTALKLKGNPSYRQNQINTTSPYPQIFHKQRLTGTSSMETENCNYYSPTTSPRIPNKEYCMQNQADTIAPHQQNYNKQRSTGTCNVPAMSYYAYSPITSPDKSSRTPNKEHSELFPRVPKEEKLEASDSKNTKCHYCATDFGNVALFTMHFSYHSQDGDPFVCSKCKLRCGDKFGFNDHVLNGSRINGMCLNE
ncbi:hypothetical protein TNIN_119651 [Trichonephila inaurata madagascariensis]|uniref:Protein hunchback n=1 Tax=Trichonephila inaurata madagascariensis TaxID=2747483 RepID=A0A8X7BUV5_9ARAC|nr:hypothetical protein TNIN_119651 [Trichonephila inaurata madagascariensis]